MAMGKRKGESRVPSGNELCAECADVACTFRELRAARGYSLHDMEALTALTALKRQTVSKVERALVVPRIDTVFRMAAAFGLSFEGFAGEVRQRTQRRQCGRGGRGGN